MSSKPSLFTDWLDPEWLSIIERVYSNIEMQKLAAFVESEYASNPDSIYPPKNSIFNALNSTPFSKVKVVIVGQDPYHGHGQAHGLSFSVLPGVPLPPSLKNIFKELQDDLKVAYPPLHGCLNSWASQGVLLLNATLTVREGLPLSHHGKGWEKFTDSVLECLSRRNDPVIFVLWGKSAEKKGGFLRKLVRPEYILTAAHPSPLSVHRGFFGCKHFSKINELLAGLGKEPIDWALDRHYA